MNLDRQPMEQVRKNGEKIHAKYYQNENGYLHGKYILYNEDGSVEFESLFNEGTGEFKDIIYEDDVIIHCQFTKGQLDGFYKAYQRGSILLDSNYVDGMQQG